MNWKKTVELYQVYCQGEVGKVVFKGVPDLPGATMLEKMNYINEVDDSFRRFVTLEPRAHAAMSVNLVMPPCRPDAHAGFIVLLADRAHPMSGSNCMCVATYLIESGQVPVEDPETIVRLDTPAGLVIARARYVERGLLSVSVDNVACFVEALDRKINTQRWGKIKVDVAFGGSYYGIVDVEQIGLSIEPRNARALAAAGVDLKAVLHDQVHVRHPEFATLDKITHIMFRGIEPDGAIRTCTVLTPGRVDRTPCGTGSSANIASCFARGHVKLGESLLSRSIIGGEFEIEVISETTVGEFSAVRPRITGRTFVVGQERLRADRNIPHPSGFALSDTWGAGR